MIRFSRLFIGTFIGLKRANPERQLQLLQKTNFATSFQIFDKKGILHENFLPADDSHELSCLIIFLFFFLKKRQNLQLSSAANYRWRLSVKHAKMHQMVSRTVSIDILLDFLIHLTT